MTSSEPVASPPIAYTELPCSICSASLEAMEENPLLPYAGDIFTSTGHYGSTMYDPMFGGEHLRIAICSPCMNSMKERGTIHRVLHSTEEIPARSVVFGSAEDSGDNPMNILRLRNERAMEQHLEAEKATDEQFVSAVFEACSLASQEGRTFRPENTAVTR